VPFSIQSISKVFTLALALGYVGEELFGRVGREPSGTAFNSIVQLEREVGIPRNPLINAGALVVTDVIVSHCGTRTAMATILELLRELSGNPAIEVDREVAESEKRWGYRNISLANFLKSFGNLDNSVDQVLEVYFQQCAIAMSCVDLARAALFLANRGSAASWDRQVVSAAGAKRINAIMLTCGHYDGSGEFAYHVGLPGKSGVGGGIVAIAPRQLAVAAWSPGLNVTGNSHAGTIALERFAELTGTSIF